MYHIIIESFGYAASVSLAIALLVNHDIKFRWFNTLGTVFFIIYGVLLNAFPIILTNGVLMLINIYALFKIYTRNENFDLLEFKGDENLVKKFISFYDRDIRTIFPDFDLSNSNGNLRFVVLRDLVIANMFIANVDDEGTAHVELNYTLIKYRDYKVGRFIFEKEKHFLLSKGVKRICYDNVTNRQHAKFLSVMGFSNEKDNGKIRYTKLL